MTIKVGDTVRIKENYRGLTGGGYYKNKVGDTFVVTSLGSHDAGSFVGQFFARGDTDGRGIWGKYLEVVIPAIEVGDMVVRTGSTMERENVFHGEEYMVSKTGAPIGSRGQTIWLHGNPYAYDSAGFAIVPQVAKEGTGKSAIDPGYYQFPGGHEVRHISAHLTSFGGQAVQYIARSTRLDGKNKGDTIENIDKAIKFLQWERDRIEAAK